MSEVEEQGNLMTRLNEIAAMQGRETWDPSKIEGFGEGSPPPAEFVPRGPVNLAEVPEGPKDEYIDEEEENLASPLIPKDKPLVLDEPRVTLEVPDLAVLGNDGLSTIATYQSRQVELTPGEATRVRDIVIMAIARSLRAQASEVDALRRKRRRVSRLVSGAAPAQAVPTAPPNTPSRRKGRPKGSRNKPKE